MNRNSGGHEMASYNMHWEQAEHNQELVNELVGQTRPIRYRDWAVTIAFYAAIHYVEALLDWGYQYHTDQEPSRRHGIRARKVEKVLTEVPVGAEYRNLLNTSITLRYLFDKGRAIALPSARWITDKDVEKLAIVALEKIKNSVMCQFEMML